MASFLEFALAVVQVGGVGLGALVFVMAFIILLQNRKAADSGLAAFRARFLTLGFAFAVFALAAWLAHPFLERATGDAQPSPKRVTVRVMPDLNVAKLPPLDMSLEPMNISVKDRQAFSLDRDATLVVGTDALLERARQKDKINLELTNANGQLIESQAALAGEMQKNPATAAAASNVIEATDKARTANAELAVGLKAGRFEASVARASEINRSATILNRSVIDAVRAEN